MSRFPPVHLVIVDLDNTLYDWVGYFAPSFEAMVEVAAEIIGVTRDTLLDDIQKVHQHYGNTEHPFALLETEAVQSKFGPVRSRGELKADLQPAFDAFDTERAMRLRLYPTVAATLRSIRSRGTTVVGHTEAKTVSASNRAKILGLDALLDGIFAPAFTGLAYPGDPSGVSSGASDFLFELDQDSVKPNPATATKIASRFGVRPAETLYVGDTLSKDVAMANAAGMMSAWARQSMRKGCGTQSFE